MPAIRRLIVTLITVLVLVVHGAAAWASIEVSGGPSCCCPDPQVCDCSDHEGDHSDAELKRCSRDAVQAAMPLHLPAILPGPAPVAIAPHPIPAPALAPAPMFEGHADRPEKPPS